jgi:hypothetical protein
MKIENVKIELLKPYEKNAKKHDTLQVEKIAKSISDYGFLQPLVVTKENEVIVGHGRLLAAQELKMVQVPCLRADQLTESQIREYRLLDNRLNESEWDIELLRLELADLPELQIHFGDLIVEKQVTDEDSVELESYWKIEVDCQGERDQEEKYKKLTELGYKCKVITF